MVGESGGARIARLARYPGMAARASPGTLFPGGPRGGGARVLRACLGQGGSGRVGQLRGPRVPEAARRAAGNLSLDPSVFASLEGYFVGAMVMAWWRVLEGWFGSVGTR